jgi:hypothetical protein
MASRIRLHNAMGLDREGGLIHDTFPGWPGPGRAHQGFGEYNQRAWYDIWAGHMLAGDASA